MNNDIAVKRKIKDSLFTSLFGIKKYLLQLYQTLHPEDVITTEEKLQDVTIKNVFVDKPYNDLGFRVGDKLIIMVEAQSTWAENILVRMLFYLAQTYSDYISNTGQDVYSSKNIKIPKPELYIVYTGNRKVTNEISLNNIFFENACKSLDVKAKVISVGTKSNIIGQYILFSKIYDKQYKLNDNKINALKVTIKICKDENILLDYLTGKGEVELMSIMELLYDPEVIMKNHDKETERSAFYKTIIYEMKKRNISFEEALKDSIVEPDEYWWYRDLHEQNLREASQKINNFK